MTMNSLRSLVEDFPIISSRPLSCMWAAPYGTGATPFTNGKPWAGHDSVTGPVAGTSSAKALVYTTGIPAPTVGTAVNGRVSAYFDSTASETVITSINFPYGAHWGGAQLSINGSGFTGKTGATGGGVALTSFTVVSDILITGVTGAHATGVVDVVVGSSSSGGTGLFEYVNPTSIFGANLKRWYAQTWDSVDVWTDESGNRNTNQSNAGARPLATNFANGHFALGFDGIGMSLQMGNSGEDIMGTEGVVAMIGYQADNGGFLQMWLSHSFGGVGFWFGSDPNGSAHNMAFGVGTTTAPDLAASNALVDDGSVRRFIGYYKNSDSPSTKLVIDGVQQTTTGAGTWATNPSDSPAIGAQMSTNDSTTATFYQGHMGEVVIANVKPTVTQLAKLNAYLRDCAGQAA